MPGGIRAFAFVQGLAGGRRDEPGDEDEQHERGNTPKLAARGAQRGLPRGGA